MLTSFLFGYMVYQMYNAELTSYLTRQETEPNQTLLTPNQTKSSNSNQTKLAKETNRNRYMSIKK